MSLFGNINLCSVAEREGEKERREGREGGREGGRERSGIVAADWPRKSTHPMVTFIRKHWEPRVTLRNSEAPTCREGVMQAS